MKKRKITNDKWTAKVEYHTTGHEKTRVKEISETKVYPKLG